MPKYKAVVFCFGRFNPPSVGHARVFQAVLTEAATRRADAVVFPSPTQGDSRNPLPFQTKMTFLRMLFPKMTFNENTAVKSAFDAVHALHLMGYRRITAVVGSDRADEYRRLFENYQRWSKPRQKTRITFNVVPVSRSPVSESATHLRECARLEQWNAFQSGVPTRNVRVARTLFESVRTYMTLTEAFQKAHARPSAKPPVFVLYGTTPRAAYWLREAVVSKTLCTLVGGRELLSLPAHVRNLMEMRDIFTVDVSNMSYVDVREVHSMLEYVGYQPHIYIREDSRLMTEGAIRALSTLGFIKRGLARDIVMVTTGKDLFEHMQRIVEAEVEKPKQPTEVDRLKTNQKMELLQTKKRQAQELLNAQQRELQKKSREDMSKISNGEKPAQTR